MGKMRKNDRVFHGDRRHGKLADVSVSGTGAQSVTLDASKHDTFAVLTAGGSTTALTLLLTNVAEGQRIMIRIDSNIAGDTVAAVKVNGTASSLIGETFVANQESSIETVAYSVSGTVVAHSIVHS